MAILLLIYGKHKKEKDNLFILCVCVCFFFFFFSFLVICQPPTTSTLSLLIDFFEKITNEWKHLPEDKPFLLYVAPRIESSIRLLIKGAFQLQPTEQNVSILFFLNILFYSHIYWHPLWREVYTKANRLNHWKEYIVRRRRAIKDILTFYRLFKTSCFSADLSFYCILFCQFFY